MRKLLPVVILGYLLLSPAGWAGKFYVGVGAGEATLEAPTEGARFSVDDTGYKVFAGYSMLRWLALEGGYTDLGNMNGQQGDLDYEAEADLLSAYAVGVLPITPRARIFAKIGLVSWDTLSTTTDGETTDRRDANGMDLGYGFGLRLEWETCDFDNTENVKFISLGAQFNF